MVARLGGQPAGCRFRQPEDSGEPRGFGGQSTHQLGDGLGGQRVRRLAQHPRQVAIDVLVVHAVAELVQDGRSPTLVGHQVVQRAHVAFAVDVDTESVLVLARPGVQVGTGEDVAHLEAETVVGGGGQGHQVLALEQPVHVHFA